ncbi:tripartite tricarboxylate transporter substrate binding protein BugD [Polynucleobacter sp. IMCC30063]|uniref:tripartite tricarboxylate transporter substrate-binding protein n=1 Tax=unclassified Polynucleobacter TaxID=2640945 RepID=UPI001F417857|nr:MULTISPECIES: tripartite tricarboxylate transporter substrate-binding protein [unclassified Polynucleobacter]MCE7506091.1 tripartite tricarboxylate transporter substrate binding protein BugD [Polynucleobacter sp. IMCC30063]MCE7528888.1 tripartite tricarboxylate transporter substrate binding protein BugD [Polynucleobacter sp. IMCC 29146]
MQITKKLVFAVSLASSIGLSTLVVQAAEFPGDRPITLIVPFAAGGPTDKVARELALVMGKQLKGQIIVENTPGAGGTIAAKKVVNAPKDGHTLLIHHIGMSTAPALYKNLGFDPMNDYEYIGQVADVPMMLIANKDLPPKNFKDLVPYMKANTSKIAYANAGIGSASHLCGLLLMSRIQIDLTTVPYKGTAPALTDLMGNQVQLMCDQTTNIGTQVTAGSVKAYGTTTLQRIKAYDKVPTLNEEGLKNFEVKVWHGVYAPKGTPKADTEKLAAALKAAIQDPSYKSKMAEMGVEIPSQANASPEGLKNHLKAQIDLWSPIIKAAGVYAD